MAPVYLSNCFKLHVPKRNLRSSKDRLRLDYPRTRVQAGDKSFTVCASKLWNNIPIHIRQSVSVNAFKKALKTYLFPNWLIDLFFHYVIYLHIFLTILFFIVSALSLWGMALHKYLLYVCMYVCMYGSPKTSVLHAVFNFVDCIACHLLVDLRITLRRSGSNTWVDFRLTLFWSFKDHFN